MRRALWVAMVLGAACSVGCGQPLDDIPVASAGLSGASWNGVAMVGGVSWSPAVLTLVEPSGEQHEFDVDISGPVLGFIFDIGGADTGGEGDLSCLFQSSASLVLPEGETLSGSEITGGYFGSKVGMHLVLGLEEHDLENGSGVKLEGGSVNFGMGFFLGFEWLDIHLK